MLMWMNLKKKSIPPGPSGIKIIAKRKGIDHKKAKISKELETKIKKVCRSEVLKHLIFLDMQELM
jgi:hypothetical protein